MLKKVWAGVFFIGASLFVTPVMSAQLTPRQAIYYHASRGNKAGLIQLQQMGYPIDVSDDYGNSALCEAVIKRDNLAIQTLIQSGADVKADCMENLSVNWQQTVPASEAGVVSTELNQRDRLASKEALKVPNPPSEPMTKNTKVGIGLGVTTALIGGGITAALLGGGGGGGSPAPACVDGVLVGNKCQCNKHALGALCDQCEAGYGLHGTRSCHADRTCLKNQEQVGDSCQCKPGYDFQGTDGCYKDLGCSKFVNMKQQKDECVCDGEIGVLYHVFPRGCFKDKDCPAHSTQQENACICDAGYYPKTEESPGSAASCATCGEHKEYDYNQKKCVCTSEFPWNDGGTCRECPTNSTWSGTECVCNADYPMMEDNVCKVCPQNSTWSGTECVCNDDNPVSSGTGSAMTCAPCQSHSTWSKTGKKCLCDSSHPVEYDGQCYEELDCDTARAQQQGPKCECIGNYAKVGEEILTCSGCKSGYMMNEFTGECVAVEVGPKNATSNHNGAIGITKDSNNKGDVIGLYYDGSGVIKAASANDYRDSWSGISLVNNGKGSVYGIYGNAITTDESGETIAGIIVNGTDGYEKIAVPRDASGNSVVYNNTRGDLTNDQVNKHKQDVIAAQTTADNDKKAKSVIEITTKTADAYGIFGFKNVYGAYAIDEHTGDVSSVIKITSNGGTITGMYGAGITDTYVLNNTELKSIIYGAKKKGDGNQATSEIILTNVGGKSYGIKGAEYEGNNEIKGSGTGNDDRLQTNNYGSVIFGAHGNAKTTINIDQKGGDAYGLYGYNVFTSEPTQSATGQTHITIDVSDNGNAYGIYVAGNTHMAQQHHARLYTSADSSITINPDNAGTVYGIYENTFVNTVTYADITIGSENAVGNIAYGIYVNGDYNSNSFGAVNKVFLVNYGDITIQGQYDKAYGIYVKRNYNGFNLINYGIIDLSGVTASTVYPIYFEHLKAGSESELAGPTDSIEQDIKMATFRNYGTLILPDYDTCEGEDCKNMQKFVGRLTDNQKATGEITEYPDQKLLPWLSNEKFYDTLLDPNPGVKYVAAAGSSIQSLGALPDTIYVDPDLTTSGFQTTYVGKDMIDAPDTSNVKLISESSLFDASLADNGHDIVMTMKNFDTMVDNTSLAKFLDKNYALGNNEAFYNRLKSFPNKDILTDSLNKLTGKEMFSRLNFEDMTMMKELNWDMNEKLFHNQSPHFALAGSVTPMAFRGDGASNARYSLYNKREDNKSIGLGVAFTNVRSDDKHRNNNRQETMYQLILPMGYKTHGFNLITSPRIGYARGSYDRTGFSGNTYDGTIEKRVFGLMNEARYPITVGTWRFEPTAEFNILGYQQKGHEDAKEFALHIKNQNTYSVEGGIGLYAIREAELDKETALKLTAGIMAYHEFADPYRLKVGMDKMAGAFTLVDEKHSDNRGVIRAGLDYVYRDLSLYGSFISYIDKENRTTAKTGLKVRF